MEISPNPLGLNPLNPDADRRARLGAAIDARMAAGAIVLDGMRRNNKSTVERGWIAEKRAKKEAARWRASAVGVNFGR